MTKKINGIGRAKEDIAWKSAGKAEASRLHTVVKCTHSPEMSDQVGAPH